MTTNEIREKTSDEQSAPLVWYVYIMELEDGDYYIGQTNDLQTRYAEHTVGGGARATSTTKCKLVWFSHTHDREAAKTMEARLQAAKGRSPNDIQNLVDRFQNLVRLVCPEKTLRELTDEQAERDRVADHSYHLLTRNVGDVFVSAVCGFDKGSDPVWGADAWTGNLNSSFEVRDVGSMTPEVLLQREKERQALESVGGKYGKRPVCVPCYKHAQRTAITKC